MKPEELQRLEKLETMLTSFLKVAPEVDPEVARTISAVVGDIPLGDLSDVVLSSPSNGQVLKFNGTVWVNGTDLT